MLKTLKRRGWIGGILFIFMLLLHVPKTFAQVPGDFNLISSPLPTLLSTKPGQSISTDLWIKNGSTKTEQLKVTLLKFKADNKGNVQLLNRESGDSYFDWVKFSPSTFTAAPNEWRTVKMTINVPKDAALGYYYAVAFSRAKDAAPTPGAATVQGQLITFVLLEAEVPNAKRSLQVTSFKADRSFYEFLPTKFSVVAKNTGNIHVAPKGNIFVYRGKKQVSIINVNEFQGTVLPNSSRTFNSQWDSGFPVYITPDENGHKVLDKNGNQVHQLHWDFSKFSSLRIGHYTAKLVLVYNDGQHDIPIQGQVSFWVIPWRLIIGLIAIPVLPALLVYLIMKRRMRGSARRRP